MNWTTFPKAAASSAASMTGKRKPVSFHYNFFNYLSTVWDIAYIVWKYLVEDPRMLCQGKRVSKIRKWSMTTANLDIHWLVLHKATFEVRGKLVVSQ